ncbi:MAG: gluconate 2-dehydrogenase subunit 3 family protein, partial [Planctomycetes bacterium]|nr:gluconate 2-dehydrogenase subunit 3 family protein [Planctomycetota bacterium]
MSFLNERQRRTLEKICDTFVPKLIPEEGDEHTLFDFCASMHDVPANVERMVEQVGGTDGQLKFKRVLKMLESRLVSGIITGVWERFSELSLEERTKILGAWRDSRRDFARRAFQAVKRITLFLAYATPDADGKHPAWTEIGYPGSCQAKRQFHATSPIKALTIDRATTLGADVLVIGSGAGGGVVAAELAAAGRDVLVVEKGDYFPDSELPGNELEGCSKLYEKKGKLTT